MLFLCNPGNPGGRHGAPQISASTRWSSPRSTTSSSPRTSATPRSISTITRRRRASCRPALATGRDKFQRCVVFHSLSKRSSVPGLRSGFVAGDPAVISKFLLYRTYHGSADARAHTDAQASPRGTTTRTPPQNRKLYQDKFAQRAADPGAGARCEAPRRRLLSLARRRARTTRSSPATCSPSRTSHCCPEAIWRGKSRARTPARGACALSLTAPSVDQCVLAAERIESLSSVPLNASHGARRGAPASAPLRPYYEHPASHH